MEQKIIIDPITRIEGHLRVEALLDSENIVKEAYVSGGLFRGIEIILKGRDPRDAPLLAQRICGVCTNVHYRASVSSIEDAYEIVIPKNATIVRDLVSLALMIQDHVVHFYHLHLLDYVDPAHALEADPYECEKTAYLYSKNPYRNSAAHYQSVKEKLTKFVKAGRLGLFANGSWGHEEYKLNPQESLLLMSAYLEALNFQKDLSKAIAIFAGKTPHPQNLVVGGVTSVADMLNPQRLNDFIFLIKEAKEFVQRAYLPNMKLLVAKYKAGIKKGEGRTCGNFLAVGGYSAFGKELFSSGAIKNHNFEKTEEFDESKIIEEVTRSWYSQDAASPIDEETNPFYTDLNLDGSLKKDDKYSWIKTPRYNGLPFESGPVARILVGYVKNNDIIKAFTDDFLKDTDLELLDLCSTMGRNVARAIEAAIVSDFLFLNLNELLENLKYYDEATWTKYDFESLPKSTKGRAFFEVPRGILGHFASMEEGKIKNYQVIAPTTWNASPKDANGLRGAYEESLIGLKLADPKNPLEILRAIRSFDPCLACAVHIVDSKGKNLAEFKVKTVCEI